MKFTDPRVVDHEVKRGKNFKKVCKQPAKLFIVTDIGPKRHRLAPRSLYGAASALGPRFVVKIVNTHIVAVLAKCNRDRFADATACAGHQRGFSFHEGSSLSCIKEWIVISVYVN
ncbi:hypothetical protein SDC9_170082 [bioreactor metagenome]|uniref:Uncharacterized protein n=1 Tax=bioreactor metagenome TaxID=1076179 RepID=A0A645GA81_9ZZZZ